MGSVHGLPKEAYEIKGIPERKGHLENRKILKTVTCAEGFRQVTVLSSD